MRRKRVDGTEGGGGRGGHREVMAVVVAEERGGGFYKKSGRAAPFVDATDGGRGARGERGWRGEPARGVAAGSGGGRTTSAMIRQKIRCTAIGCSQFELLASPVAVRQTLPDLLDTRSLSFAPSFSVSPDSPSPALCSSHSVAAAAAAAVSSVEPPSPSPSLPFSGEWAPARRAEKTSKKNPILLPW